MGYKSLLFTNPCKLSVKKNQLVFQNEDETITVPMEDISTIVLENPQITVTNYLLSMCSEYDIVLFTCDKKHHPNAILTPFCKHSRMTKVSYLQIGASEVLKKRLWQKIVKQKIINQSNTLKALYETDELDFFIDKVQSGDKTNIEGQASKKYWNLLFKNFKRHSEDKTNAALNYGYAIIRGMLAKHIASSGLIPCFGIHHCSELNAFNLADDLIEPFRPFIDLTVAKMDNLEKDDLTKEDRAYLVSILNAQCQYKKEQITIQNACRNICKSFVTCLEFNNCNLLEMPEFIEEK